MSVCGYFIRCDERIDIVFGEEFVGELEDCEGVVIFGCRGDGI